MLAAVFREDAPAAENADWEPVQVQARNRTIDEASLPLRSSWAQGVRPKTFLGSLVEEHAPGKIFLANVRGNGICQGLELIAFTEPGVKFGVLGRNLATLMQHRVLN